MRRPTLWEATLLVVLALAILKSIRESHETLDPAWLACVLICWSGIWRERRR